MEQRIAAVLSSVFGEQLQHTIPRPMTRATPRRRAKRPLFSMNKAASGAESAAATPDPGYESVRNEELTAGLDHARGVRILRALSGRAPPPAQDELNTTTRQTAFLAAIMHDDVDCYDGCINHEAIIAQYRRFSEYTGFLGIDMQQYEIAESDIHGNDELVKIYGSGIIRTSLVRKMLIAVFPHILAHGELWSRLVGQRIDFPCAIQFIFNSDGKVYEFRVEIDFVARLSATLGPEDIALVLGNARIAHSMLCIDDEPEDIDGACVVSNGDYVLEELTVCGGELMGELPSLFALGGSDDIDDDMAFACVDVGVLAIDLAELINF